MSGFAVPGVMEGGRTGKKVRWTVLVAGVGCLVLPQKHPVAPPAFAESPQLAGEETRVSAPIRPSS